MFALETIELLLFTALGLVLGSAAKSSSCVCLRGWIRPTRANAPATTPQAPTMRYPRYPQLLDLAARARNALIAYTR